ncbi:unannotated protein [freshwater metagenome]|uniref:Unannotated protein n=1 Tax=freshwater metagenome TaxID=449393 RepID=A0A6J7HS12_9ZZZZ|nr:hypothetical protein [Actinomycetota bacterium]
MFQALRPYPSYQLASGPFASRIPHGWSRRRLASLGGQVKETSRPDLPLLSVYLGRGVIPYAEGGRRVHAPSEKLDGYQVVRDGDLVLNNQQAWRGSVGVSRYTGIISPAYIVWRLPSDLDTQFAELLFPSRPMVDQYVHASRGVGDIQRDMHMPSMRNMAVPVPPLAEQVAIARYLIHANARIDKAIAAKRRLIALLAEADRAIANRIVGSGSRKDVGWPGGIPGDWKVVPAKRLFREVDRRSQTGAEGLLSLRMREGLVDAKAYTSTPIPSSNLVGYKVVRPGEIVMNRMRASIGLFGVAHVSGLVSPDYSTMTVADDVDPDFFLLLFKSELAMAEFRRRSTGLGTGASGFMRLYYEEFGAIPMPVPPISEQRRLVAAVNEQRNAVAPVIDRAHREIALLREFRTRLVADVVTGQVDVRAVAAALPGVDQHAAWGESGDADAIEPADFDDIVDASEV